MLKIIPYLKIIVFFLCLLPFLLLVYDILADNIIDPIEEITNPTGQWALRFLLITLSITPIVYFSKQRYLMKFRRMLGLFVFFYICLHFSIYLIDQEFDIKLILEDVTDRTYITLGFTAFLLLIPMAFTSTKGWIRRLGRKWKKIHNSIYVIAILACIHFYWQSKSDAALQPFIYAGILAILLGFRLYKKYK